jgi:hypothetical protein
MYTLSSYKPKKFQQPSARELVAFFGIGKVEFKQQGTIINIKCIAKH